MMLGWTLISVVFYKYSFQYFCYRKIEDWKKMLYHLDSDFLRSSMYETFNTRGDTVGLNKTESFHLLLGLCAAAVKRTGGLVQIVSSFCVIFGNVSTYSPSTKVINGHKCFKLECGISVQNLYWLYLIGSELNE